MARAACPATTTSARCPRGTCSRRWGVFPQVPGRAELLVGSPLFPTVHVARDNGVGIVIDAPATTDAAQYVQSATLDGVAYGKSWLPESFVRTGGTLNLTMGTAASTWGSPPPDQVGVASFCGPVSRPQGTAVSTWPFDGTAGGATLVGAPQWTAGHAGQALLLNGSGQYADTGRAVLPTTGNYTVAAWVRLDAAGAFRTVVSQDGATSSAFFLQYSGADKTFAMSFADRRALAPLTPVTGRWYHLAGVRDANAGHLSLYVDGVLARQIDACTADAATGPLVIGRARWGGAPVDYWAGAIDDVRAYDRALTAAQVKALV
ncbi:LamG-like jellyroll fold domain-containing protein [Dactylosporangium sp. CA-152071]|uniref:LamG domain-containing protein n=1 Tax=Dactylosporangium sp. CA-152071 TaxID=3239933 RepID=UPI003D8C4A8D